MTKDKQINRLYIHCITSSFLFVVVLVGSVLLNKEANISQNVWKDVVSIFGCFLPEEVVFHLLSSGKGVLFHSSNSLCVI